MKLKFLIISVFFTCLFSEAFGSMRRCMLLPVKDSVGGAIGFKVYEQVENYLLDSDWCYYKANSEILNILGNYKRNLDEYLNNPEVIELIGSKTRAGSIIKISIISQVKGINLLIQIFGSNGRDLLFTENTKLSTDDPSVIARAVINWLNVYEKSIPYHGLVTGVMGNQFTSDIGKEFGAHPGQNIEIFRPTVKKRHPLFKEIVDYDSIKIGNGKLAHITKSLSKGKVFKYDSFKRLKLGDWVILKARNQKFENMMGNRFDKKNTRSFGKLGQLGFFFTLGAGSDSFTQESTSVKKIGGSLFGAEIWGEIWATRNYWLSLEISRKIGKYKKKEGNISTPSNSASNGLYKFRVGYRYLPLGFFYGPRIDGYIGYAKYEYGLDNQLADGFAAVNFSGIMIGTKGSLPILKGYRIHMVFDFILSSKYEEEVVLYGEDDSSSNYHFEIGGSYKYAPNLEIEGSIGYHSNKAKFVAPQRVLVLGDTVFKVGTILNF